MLTVTDPTGWTKRRIRFGAPHPGQREIEGFSCPDGHLWEIAADFKPTNAKPPTLKAVKDLDRHIQEQERAGYAYVSLLRDGGAYLLSRYRHATSLQFWDGLEPAQVRLRTAVARQDAANCAISAFWTQHPDLFAIFAPLEAERKSTFSEAVFAKQAVRHAGMGTLGPWQPGPRRGNSRAIVRPLLNGHGERALIYRIGTRTEKRWIVVQGSWEQICGRQHDTIEDAKSTADLALAQVGYTLLNPPRAPILETDDDSEEL